MARWPTAVVVALALVATGLAGCSEIPRPGGSSTADGNASSAAPDDNAPDVPFGAAALDSGYRLFGVKLAKWPSDENGAIAAFESKTKTRVDIVDIYMDWQTPWRNVSHAVRHTTDHGSVASITWDPTGLTTTDILNGSTSLTMRDGTTMTVDAYLNQFAVGACEAVASTDNPILLRPLRDANGDWNSWAIGYSDGASTPNTPETYEQAWTAIRDVFGQYCDPGTDILFVFSVSHTDTGDNATFEQAFPGDAAVDYVGIAGYNWGDHQEWGWQSHSNLFRGAYCNIAPQTSKPMLVTEWSSVEAGGNKKLWIATAMDELASGKYPKIHGLIWVDDLGDGQAEWGVDSSSGALSEYSNGVSTMQEQRAGGATQTSLEAGSPCT